MKANYVVLSLLICLSSLFMLGGCTNDEKELSVVELPADMRWSLSSYFPGETPLKVEKVKLSDSEYSYCATFSNNVFAYFDEKGNWLQFCFPDGNAPEEIVKRFDEVFDFMKTSYQGHHVTILTSTKYGVSATLENKETLAFDHLAYIGHDLGMNGEAKLPKDIQDFKSQYFAEVPYRDILVNEEINQERSYKYKIWLEDNVMIEFASDNLYTIIDGNGSPLPEAISHALPEKVKEQMTTHKTIYRIQKHEDKKYYEVKVTQSNSLILHTDGPINITINDNKIEDFINKYFGHYTRRVITIPNSGFERPKEFEVKIPNGFNFKLSLDYYQWTKIDGYGRPFSDSLKTLLPEKALQYIASNSQAEITMMEELEEGYLVLLTDGKAFEFNSGWTFIKEQAYSRTPYEKVHAYIRYHYPEDINAWFYSSTGDGIYTFKLGDGTFLKFNSEGNLIE